MTPVIEVDGLRAGYGARVVFNDLRLHVEEREMVALVGGNGAGKSTLLKVIAGVLPVLGGTVRVFGGMPGASSQRVVYLPQSEHLRWDYPLLVENVVLMGRIARLGIGRRAGSADVAAALAALDRVAASHLRRRSIGELSGGERQRVLLARTLAAESDLLLLDEPATGVDPATEEQLMEILEQLAREGRTVLVSTHDLGSVMAHFKRVICMNGGIVADGDVSILRDDAILRQTYGGHRGGDTYRAGDQHH